MIPRLEWHEYEDTEFGFGFVLGRVRSGAWILEVGLGARFLSCTIKEGSW